MLKVSAYYLGKQKSLFQKRIFFKKYQYQNKKALFTDSIIREGFDTSHEAATIDVAKPVMKFAI